MMTLGMRLEKHQLRIALAPSSAVSSSNTTLTTFWAGVRESRTSAVEAALLGIGDEFLDDLEVDVGLKQRHADLAHRAALISSSVRRPFQRRPGRSIVEAIGEGLSNSCHVNSPYIR